MKLSNRKGFTLIEVMIVIAIIGILIAIAVPQFVSYRKRAMEADRTNMSGTIPSYDVTGEDVEDIYQSSPLGERR